MDGRCLFGWSVDRSRNNFSVPAHSHCCHICRMVKQGFCDLVSPLSAAVVIFNYDYSKQMLPKEFLENSFFFLDSTDNNHLNVDYLNFVLW